MEFNEQYWRHQIKLGIGLAEIPDEELGDYKVAVDNRMFGDVVEELTISVPEYIERELAAIRESYQSANRPQEDYSELLDTINTDLLKTPATTVEQAELTDVSRTTLRGFHSMIDAQHFIVIINTEVNDYDQQMSFIRSCPLILGEVDLSKLYGVEKVLSYYQFVNMVQDKLTPKQDVSAFEHILTNVDSVFEGFDLDNPSVNKFK